VDGNGKAFTEFCTMLNLNPGGGLLVIRKPPAGVTEVTIEMPSVPTPQDAALPPVIRGAKAKVVQAATMQGWGLWGLAFDRPLVRVPKALNPSDPLK